MKTLIFLLTLVGSTGALYSKSSNLLFIAEAEASTKPLLDPYDLMQGSNDKEENWVPQSLPADRVELSMGS